MKMKLNLAFKIARMHDQTHTKKETKKRITKFSFKWTCNSSQKHQPTDLNLVFKIANKYVLSNTQKKETKKNCE